ncbi:glycosyltransferase family 4 protein [Butyrivibrio proteoclasticus]|uniref:glycosyltransferase family 4 protein n=1 Tax=Butyrivibrio proteoclasticus TaxID=43305 RepID=UPI00047923E6|nr:glycosyltransferase family 4 protein [Butyrivibrio proteoclasticus]
MRLLYFLAHPDTIGGAAKVMIKHAFIMQQRKNEVLVVIQKDSQGYYSSNYDFLCQSYSLKTVSLCYPIATCIEELNYHDAIKAEPAIKRLVKKYKPEIIHSLQLNLAVEIVSRKLNIPNIMSVYQADKSMFRIEWDDVMPHYLIGDSEYYSNMWKNGLDLESKCIRVPYDVKTTAMVVKENRECIEIVNIAGFCEHKRQLEIIKFIELCGLNSIKVHMTFVGDDQNKYADECKEYVNGHELTKNVSFLGFVNDVEKYLNAADVMIQASTVESFPGAIVEAMAYGIPVITTQVGGISELIKDRENGFLIDGYSASDIFNSFKLYLEDANSGRIEKISAAEKNTYTSNHTFEKVGKELDGFYKKVLLSDYKNRNEHALDLFVTRAENSIGIRFNSRFSSYTKAHLWYLYYINDICRTNGFETAVVWGAGNLGNIGFEWADILNLEVKSVIDSYKTGCFNGYDILQPSEKIVKCEDVVIVSIARYDALVEISALLESYGRKRNEDFFLIYNSPVLR